MIDCRMASAPGEATLPGVTALTRTPRHAARLLQPGLQGYLTAITDLLRDSARQNNTKLDPRRAREQAIALFSQLVGAQLLARAVAQADPELSDEVLASNTKELKRR